MKKKSPSNDVPRRVDRLLIDHKSLAAARKNSTDKKLWDSLEKKVNQFIQKLPKNRLHPLDEETIAYRLARLDALEREYRKLKSKEASRNEAIVGGSEGEMLLLDNKGKKTGRKSPEHRAGDGSPVAHLSVNWLAPMPIWSETAQFGYCQATGKIRTTIRRVLKSIDAKVAGKGKKAGRGKPPQLYTVSTNLKVLDHWLGCWVDQSPENVGWTAVLIFNGMFSFQRRLENEGQKPNASSAQKKQFARVIKKHLRRVRKRLSDSQLTEEEDAILKCSLTEEVDAILKCSVLP